MTIGPLTNHWKIHRPPVQRMSPVEPPPEVTRDEREVSSPPPVAARTITTSTVRSDSEFVKLLARDQSLLTGVGGGVLAGMAALWIHSPPPALPPNKPGECRNSPLAVAFDRCVEQLTEARPGQTIGLQCSLMEQALSDPNATVAAKQRLGGGINTAYLVTLSNGARGVFKPVAGEHQGEIRSQVEVGQQGPRELAAYVIDKKMGHLGRVPPTVRRELDGQDGYLLAYVHNARVAAMSPASGKILRDSTSQAFRRMAVLDEVLGNLDRHAGNWMVTSSGQPIPIDHGLTMPLSNTGGDRGTREFYAPRRLDAESQKALERLVRKRPEVEAELSPLLAKRAVNAMYERVENLLKSNQERNL